MYQPSNQARRDVWGSGKDCTSIPKVQREGQEKEIVSTGWKDSGTRSSQEKHMVKRRLTGGNEGQVTRHSQSGDQKTA